VKLHQKSILFWFSARVALFALLAIPAFAQDESSTVGVGKDVAESASTTETDGVKFENPEDIYWEFGVRITANGAASGITATAPVPVDWPEQQVEIVSQQKSDNVGRVSIKKLTSDSRQLVCKINRLASGEVAEAVVRFKVIKRQIAAPSDPSRLRIAKQVPSRLKQYLRPSPYIESQHPRIRKIASEIGVDEGLSDWQRVEEIYKWVREHVEYEFDTQIHSCLDALDSGHGDCEELSSLFIAICRAKGIPARAVWIPSHTYPEFYLTDDAGNDHWIPCQAAGSYEFGAMTESRPILQKGDSFKLPGNPQPIRYIQPVLVAKDAAGTLGFEFINRAADSEDTTSDAGERDR
jgi:hypothetical protein